MTLDEIETVAGQRLEDMGSTPIAWPNDDFKPSGAYIDFRHVPNTVEDPVISGGYEYEIGIFVITVVTPAGRYSGAGNALAENVRRQFPKALRLSSTSGTVVINGAPSFGTPFQDGAYWRQPVTVPYITE